ncbi:hypothetical protein NKH58_25480 [Mesorhizobium australicum]|uniref:hypothetical protein n=1 Tax=Mesorhizobium australicum TaxID=536018 RepID=UPI0033381AFE
MTNAHRNDLASLIEELAAVEHERWAHWQTFVHSKGERLPDGSLVLPADLVQRWERQIAMAYDDLPEQERQSDREQVEKYFPIIRRWLASRGYSV